MDKIQNQYRNAGLCFYASSFLHVVAIALSGGALFGTFVLPVILWALIGYGLINRDWRWLAHVGFIGALVGIVVSISTATQFDGLTRLSVFAITLADLAAAILLFGALWRTPVRA